jgi:phosphoglycolate phosphatase
MSLALRSVTIDLDGTLLDTLDDLAAGCNGMLAELGLPQRSRSEIESFVGDGMAALVERCLTWGAVPTGEQMQVAVTAFKRHYARANGQSSRLYPDVLAGLQSLRAQGLVLAVVTNKPAMFTEPLLQATGLAPYFAAVVSGDSLPHKKPHPLQIIHACGLLGSTPGQNLHVGDSLNDALAARAAGSLVYCVTYGYSHGEPVDTASCDALVSDLLDVAQKIAGATDPHLAD